MRKILAAGTILLCVVLAANIFAQTSNATVGGIVADATGALLPGVMITATNIATGIVNTVVSNEAGAYQFASLQTGTYKITAELVGFQAQAYNAVALGISQQVRLNFTLQVSSVAQTVEVTVAADTAIATTSSSVGTVLPEYKVRDLPLGGRNVLDLLATTTGAGVVDGVAEGLYADAGYFAGGRPSAANTTRDGFVVSDGRQLFGAFSVTYASPDLVEEVRVISAPVDAELGRGSGQVQMVTRSGTNQFRGSAFWNNRNSALDSTNWFNNFTNTPKDWENRNQFGARLGGPIFKNKTFFFVLVDEQRDLFKQTFVGTVLTPQARQGIFRFFPGADNQNANANNPTVDRNGNPVLNRQPATPQSFSVFNRDPNRLGFDRTGFIQNTLLSRMPLPNDYTVGDGLNTAGIRFNRRISGIDTSDGNGYGTNRDQFNMRIDHNFNSNHKLSGTYTWERDLDMTTQAGIMQWPGGYNGANNRWPRVANISFVSTLSPTIVNELRVGYRRSKQTSYAPWYVGREGINPGEPVEPGLTAFKLLPKYNGIPLEVSTVLFPQNFMNWPAADGSSRTSVSPISTYADTLSWTKGAHAFKAGGEIRLVRTTGGNDTNITPLATLGAGGAAVTGIDNVTIRDLTGNNQTTARNLLTDLSGSINQIAEGFDVRKPTDAVFGGYADGIRYRLRDWHSNESSWFFKDSWKV
ncbi:MAG TPA: carboxypeptidase-like regulatory domain-containing protein, partial [Terriglobia bacterium]|nr:carboxypeptidase-like regulatory domain-containing protein [Terriglobia bacterium]